MKIPRKDWAEKRKEFFISCYKRGMTYEQIGKMAGISRQRVFQIVSCIYKSPIKRKKVLIDNFSQEWEALQKTK